MENEKVQQEIGRLYREGVPENEIARRMNVKRYIVRNGIIFEKGRQAGLAEARPGQPGSYFPGIITISLAAEQMNVSRQAAHRMVQTGRLRAWRLESAGNDRPLVVDKEEVEKRVAGRSEEIEVPVDYAVQPSA